MTNTDKTLSAERRKDIAGALEDMAETLGLAKGYQAILRNASEALREASRTQSPAEWQVEGVAWTKVRIDTQPDADGWCFCTPANHPQDIAEGRAAGDWNKGSQFYGQVRAASIAPPAPDKWPRPLLRWESRFSSMRRGYGVFGDEMAAFDTEYLSEQEIAAEEAESQARYEELFFSTLRPWLTPPAPERSKEEVFSKLHKAYLRGVGWAGRNPDANEAEQYKAAYDYADAETSALEPSPIHKGEVIGWAFDIATRVAMVSDEPAQYTSFEPRISFDRPSVPEGSIRNLRPLYASPHPVTISPEEGVRERAFDNHQWPLGTRVTKTKGSSWTGRVVGYYSTSMTPVGYAVESENEPGSVQIYPLAALSVKPGEQE